MSETISNELLVQAAKTFGTPVYVYHAEKISRQYQNLLDSFADTKVRFYYAAKALTNLSILKHVKSLGSGIDCSSINEVKLALKAGFQPENILYTSNNIHFSEIEQAHDFGVHINIDSLSNLQKFGEKYGHSYPVGIRLRPNIMAGGNLKISTGHSSSKFGVPVEQLSDLLTLVKQTNLHIRTLHIHTGSEIKDVEVFVKGLSVIFELVEHFPELEVVDLGGGFKVPYKPDEVGTDMKLLGEEVSKAFEKFEKEKGRSFQVWFEPGKYMVSECGHFVTTVNVLKHSGDIRFAGVDSGLNHLIRPMFYGSYHKIENISNPSGPMFDYNVVGYICETDNFAESRTLNEISEGDLLVLRNAGAYCYEMASNYNSRFRPAEVLCKDGSLQLIRERETFEDLLKGQLL
jgi:diaminopimelate decarboxylase